MAVDSSAFPGDDALQPSAVALPDLAAVRGFLACATPEEWLGAALAQPDVLLIDHAHCEKKAAGTALNLIFRYVDRPELLNGLSQLAREELLHFEQVLELMRERGIRYRHLSPSRYAAGLRAGVRGEEPGRLVDLLIVGAFIEARSCERFAALAPRVEPALGRYYRFLLKSESRHFEDYLALARLYAGEDITPRIERFRALEASLICAVDPGPLRFHSGVPAAPAMAVSGDRLQ